MHTTRRTWRKRALKLERQTRASRWDSLPVYEISAHPLKNIPIGERTARAKRARRTITTHSWETVILAATESIGAPLGSGTALQADITLLDHPCLAKAARVYFKNRLSETLHRISPVAITWKGITLLTYSMSRFRSGMYKRSRTDF